MRIPEATDDPAWARHPLVRKLTFGTAFVFVAFLSVKQVSYEASMAGTQTFECGGSADALSSAATPPSLWLAAGRCAEVGALRQAVAFYMLGALYGQYDTFRVSDKSAHRVGSNGGTYVNLRLTPNLAEAFGAELGKTMQSPAAREDLCTLARRIGPPTYHPDYMLRQGLGSFAGQKMPEGLNPAFDAQQAWASSLRAILLCGVGQATLEP